MWVVLILKQESIQNLLLADVERMYGTLMTRMLCNADLHGFFFKIPSNIWNVDANVARMYGTRMTRMLRNADNTDFF